MKSKADSISMRNLFFYQLLIVTLIQVTSVNKDLEVNLIAVDIMLSNLTILALSFTISKRMPGDYNKFLNLSIVFVYISNIVLRSVLYSNFLIITHSVFHNSIKFLIVSKFPCFKMMLIPLLVEILLKFLDVVALWDNTLWSVLILDILISTTILNPYISMRKKVFVDRLKSKFDFEWMFSAVIIVDSEIRTVYMNNAAREMSSSIIQENSIDGSSSTEDKTLSRSMPYNRNSLVKLYKQSYKFIEDMDICKNCICNSEDYSNVSFEILRNITQFDFPLSDKIEAIVKSRLLTDSDIIALFNYLKSQILTSARPVNIGHIETISKSNTKEYYSLYFKKHHSNLICLSFRNVTNKLKLKKQTKQMIQKTLFLAKIVHDFKTPLISVSEICKNILLKAESLGLSNDIVEDLKYGNSLSDYLMIMVEDLNEFARSEVNVNKLDIDHEDRDSGFFDKMDSNKDNGIACQEELELLPLLNFCYNIYKQKQKYDPNKQNLKIGLDIGENLPRTVQSNETKLKQVIINLMSNAYKFTTNGQVVLSAKKEDSTVRISIEDTGTGMTPDEISKIFEPFKMLDKHKSYNSNGSGLGLSIVTDMLEQLNSKLDLASVPNEGSKFSFLLQSGAHLNSPVGGKRDETVSPVKSPSIRDKMFINAFKHIVNQKPFVPLTIRKPPCFSKIA